MQDIPINSNEFLILISNLATPLTIITGMFLITFLGRSFITEFKRVNAENLDRSRGDRSVVNSYNTTNQEEISDRGGFAFFDIEDDKKLVFVDIISGFRDFAKIKGYTVSIDIDTSVPGKVGIRISIGESGIVFSKEQVRRDVDEYIRKLNHSAELDDLPMVIDPVEHHRLISALKARFAFARVEAEMHEAAEKFYKGLLESIGALKNLGMEYRHPSPPMHFYLQAEGGRAMGDNYTATNSPAAAVGKNNKVRVKGSNFNIGSTQNEKSDRIESLKELISALNSSNINEDHKNKAVRNLENAKEEIEDSKEPDESRIWTWLERAGTIIEGATAGSELLEKARSTMELFGMSS